MLASASAPDFIVKMACAAISMDSLPKLSSLVCMAATVANPLFANHMIQSSAWLPTHGIVPP